MLPTMRYRLALDLGSTSIGWALIRLNPAGDVTAIIRAGVRLFSDGRNPKDGSSLAVTRRTARSMRRRRDRLLKRKQRLFAALVRLGFFPAEAEAQKALLNLNPYQLRSEGITRALSGPEFARALFHINQRRGFLSNRKTDKTASDSGALKSAIRQLKDKLKQEQCVTLGQWLHLRHEQGASVRARLRGKTVKEKAYDFYADRSMIEDEFDALWQIQAGHNPSLFNPAAGAELKDILLHQRPLRPVVPGRCSLMPEERRAPLALPSTQQFRIYQELNNLRILLPDLAEQALSIEQRQVLADLLERQNTLTFNAMLKALKLPGSTKFNLEDIKRDRLRGNATSVALEKHFGPAWFAFSLAKQDQIVLQLLEQESESVLIHWLQEHTGVDEAKAEAIANASLPEGYGNLSQAALERILPKLKEQVITYDKAVLLAGFDSHSALSHAEQTGEIMPQLPYYGIPLQRHVAFAKDKPRNDEEQYGKIANPTVHIGLNQVRIVVNQLIEEYGHPSEVTLEVARDLKLSRERKLELEREQKQRQEKNERLVKEACVIIGVQAGNLDKAKRRHLSQKMQLWEELNPKDVLSRFCPYTGERISIERLLSDEVEIEHILPYSKTLDDGMSNKTVALTRANRDKGNQTPYEAFGRQPQLGYDYNAILQRVASMPAAKRNRFAVDGMQRWLKEDKDFLARALNDTAYLSRIAKEYLSCICPAKHVNAIPGRMTAMLRAKFGLNKLLSGSNEKNREDHRHHALDAMVIGITDRAMLQKFATASAKARALELDRLVDSIEFPWTSYYQHVQRALASIYISHKPDHGYQGAMHEESAWGFRADGQVQRWVRPEEGGKPVLKVESKNLIPMREATQNARHGLDAAGQAKAYKGYVGGSNYCMEIWRDEKGRWQGDVVSTFEAYQIVRQLGEEAGWRRLRHPTLSQSNHPLVMRLMMKDYLRLELDGVVRTMVVVTIKSSRQVLLAEHHEANVDARNRDKNNTFSYVSKMPGSLQTAKGRRCTVSASGRLRDPGFKA